MNLESFQKRVGQNIKKCRTSKGWTQFDMTEFGFSLRQFQYIESGVRNISLQTILRLSNAFGVQPHELLK
ncbi:MAG: helix-turn-helix transcriptional regulator [Deltaproteobacteria bacterium]|nr:MAG: helix-turn-helix transcriptional regulator [Deltaproteobacteria bacterium]